MAGPTRRSPFDQADDGHQVYSPLTNLVRKASQTGRIPNLSQLGNSNGTHSDPSRSLNMRSVAAERSRKEKVVPPNLVLRSSSPDNANSGHRRAQPSSPLLHTRFRASVATSIGSASDLDSQHRDSQELHYAHQPHSSGSDYTPSPTAHRPFAYIVDDTHAGGSPTSQYSMPGSAGRPTPGPQSPSLTQPFQFDSRTSVAPSDVGSVAAPFQYDHRASSLTVSTDAPFQYDDAHNTPSKTNGGLSSGPFANGRASARSSSAYNPRGTWRSSAAPDPDPFSFRDYEAPRVEPPIVVVHSPMSTIQDNGDEDVDGEFFLGERAGSSSSHSQPGDDSEDLGSTSYDDAYEYVYGAIEADDQPATNEDEEATETGHYFAPAPQPDRYSASEYTETGSYFAPEPTETLPAAMSKMSVASSGGRVASVVAGGARYNYSRPMRAGGGASISGTSAIQPDSTQPRTLKTSASQGALSSSGSVLSEASGSSGQTGSSAGASPGPGRSPLRKGTGPLIFQNNSPVEESRDREYPYQYSPGPPSATSEGHNSQYASPRPPQSPQPAPGHPHQPTPPGRPADRPPSLYSQYSFYSLPNSTPPESPRATPSDQSRQVKPKASGSLLNPNTQSRSGSPQTAPIKSPTSAAQHYLHLGITAHESGNLRESARCFERSATEGGGCGVGMLMWGLSLRHGWGCRKDERTGFRWLRKAAEAAVSDLEGARSGEEAKAVRNELVLAIYEVGQCFFHGWGVGQDKTMAVSYFQVAARLGDCDAQQELAFCYLNGKGCKKDMKEAARWYRAAAAQGASTVGLAWIYKSKYA